MNIADETRKVVMRALFTGIAKTRPAWESVPTDPCQPTGEMKNVVVTDVTPLVNHMLEALMPLVKRAQAEAWEDARRSVRSLPHWYNPDDRYGEFDLQPLGPDETSEAGAFMAVMEILGDNPYIENERERAEPQRVEGLRRSAITNRYIPRREENEGERA